MARISLSSLLALLVFFAGALSAAAQDLSPVPVFDDSMSDGLVPLVLFVASAGAIMAFAALFAIVLLRPRMPNLRDLDNEVPTGRVVPLRQRKHPHPPRRHAPRARPA